MQHVHSFFLGSPEDEHPEHLGDHYGADSNVDGSIVHVHWISDPALARRVASKLAAGAFRTVQAPSTCTVGTPGGPLLPERYVPERVEHPQHTDRPEIDAS